MQPGRLRIRGFVWTATLLAVAGAWAETVDFEALPEGAIATSRCGC